MAGVPANAAAGTPWAPDSGQARPDVTAAPAQQPRRGESAAFGFSWYWLTLLPVLAGLSFAVDFVPRHWHPHQNGPGFVEAFGAWDAFEYRRIVEEGYEFTPGKASNVAFFPAYPLLGRAVKEVTGLSTHLSLLLVAHVCLLGAFVLLAAYARERSAGEPRLSEYALLAFGLWPTTFFFRMAYSESLFVFVTLAAMLGMVRRWPAWIVAVVIGLATACRPVGVSLLPVLLWDLWDRSRSLMPFLLRAAVLGPLACWGLIAFMAYQQAAFGDALAFVHTQDNFVRPAGPFLDRLPGLLTFRPLWAVYLPSDTSHWATIEPVDNPLYSLHFANPIWFGGTALLIAYGTWKGWLDRREWLLAAGLLLIPYVTHSQRALMMAHGRYAAAAFPVYLVLGRLLMRLPPPLRVVAGGYAMFLLGTYAALFASWYRFI